jgi:hypothetical protein
MLEELFITIDLPSAEAVEKHSRSKPRGRKFPPLGVVCLLTGAFLSVGAGAFLIALGSLR